MKKVKTVKPFYFKDGLEATISQINEELPITCEYMGDLVNRIHEKYPEVDKTNIAHVVKAFLTVMREIIISSKIINLDKYLFDMKLLVYTVRKFPAIKMHLSTPPPLKKS